MFVLKCSLLNRGYVLINALKALVSSIFMCSLHVILIILGEEYNSRSSLLCNFLRSPVTSSLRDEMGGPCSTNGGEEEHV
jgi:hypothetical protein